jgi:hypothetical protein
VDPVDALPAGIRATRTLADDATRTLVGRHDFLCCDVAVELLGARKDVTAEQFAHWARVSTLLDHPNCARVEEFGELEGRPYLIYRGSFVHVTHLQLPLSPARLGKIASGVLRALEHAHHRGIYHGWLNVDALLVPESDLANVKVKNFAIDSCLGPEDAHIRDDLVAVGEIVWWLATASEVLDPDNRDIRLPVSTRDLVKRLCGLGPKPPFATATEALRMLERSFSGAGGELSSGPGWATPDEHPLEEPEPTPEPEPVLAPIDDVEERRHRQRRAAVLRGASIVTITASIVVMGLVLATRLFLGAQEPSVAKAISTGEVFEQLDRVNDPAIATAMPRAKRTALVARLRRDPRVADLIDEQLQVALDLDQAGAADDPCRAFAAALDRIAAAPAVYFRDPLRRAEVPSACDAELDERLRLLRAAIGR